MAGNASRGRFVWYELMTSDPAAARSFYTQLVGWGTQDWEGKVTYTMFTNNDQPLAGLMELPEEARQAGAPPHWIGYVSTPDTDKTLEQATGLGAKVLVPATDIPEVGRFAVLQDPQGVTIALLTALEEAPEHEGTPPVGTCSWHELATTDYGAAFGFYNALFGWDKTEAMDMGEAGTYQMYGRGDATLGGMFNKSADMPGPPAWLYYFAVADVNASAGHVKELGGQVLVGPIEVPGGDLIIQAMDPQGAMFALHSTKE